MRIGIFSNTYHPAVNGVALCVEQYVKGLQARGHEVVIFAPAPDDYDRSQDPEWVYRFPALPLPVEMDYSIAVPYSRQVAKALRRLDFDIIHTQHPWWVGAWGQWYARWTNTPLVTTVHSHYWLFARLVPLPEPLVESYMRMRVAAHCNKCDLVATPVESMRRMLEQEGVRTPIEIVPNPTDLARFRDAEGGAVRGRYGLPPEAVVLGFVGRLSPEKNLPFLLEAVGQVLRSHPEAYLLVVGEGSERADLEQQVARQHLTGRVLLAGLVPHEEIPQYQAAFDLFVTASLGETQPLAYTEAMAAGRPVVAVAGPGAEDMIQPDYNGLLAPAGAEPTVLASRIEELVEDPTRRARLGAQARESALRFDLPAVAERLEQVYHRALAEAAEEPI